MDDYESGSSDDEDVATSVLLGYASKEATSDDFSQLGGHPKWLDGKTAPSAALAKCTVCNGWLSLLLQLHGDLLAQFPNHQRRLYVWACKRKACRRKSGSIRGFRGLRTSDVVSGPVSPAQDTATSDSTNKSSVKPPVNLGDSLFGAKTSSTTKSNPFATSGDGGSAANPFSTASSLAAKPAQKPAAESVEPLTQTFAEKARISAPPSQPLATTSELEPDEPWPNTTAFPEPYPSYSIDADNEYLEPDSQNIPANARLDRNGESSSSGGSGAEDKLLFESSMDKTFQRLADRLSQNPEQVLRYEYSGQPLLYSRTDAVGKLLAPEDEHSNAKVQTVARAGASTAMSKVPRCPNCGSHRVFELQLTPHAITELEADDMSMDGMEWGTILLYVCSADCHLKGSAQGEVGYLEEWVGVQWEEISGKPRR